MSESSKSAETRERLISNLKSMFRKPIHALMDQIFSGNNSAEAELVEVLEFTAVLEYAAAMRERNAKIVSFLLNRKKVDDGWSLEQVFADQDGSLIEKGRGLLGRRLRVRTFDSELEEAFGDDTTLVLEIPEY